MLWYFSNFASVLGDVRSRSAIEAINQQTIMRVINKVAKSIRRDMDGSDIVIGPVVSRPSYDTSMLIPYFDVATSGRKQFRSVRSYRC
jgi:hypothetical protein